jgi:putative oxidoreductase
MLALQNKFPAKGYSQLPIRLIVGFGFAAHGYAKIDRGVENFAHILSALGVPFPNVAAYTTAWLELAGGIFLMMGVWIAPLSVPLSITMLVALFTVHLPYGFSTIKLRGISPTGAEFGPPGYELNLFYIAGLLALALGGPGPYAVHFHLWSKFKKKRSSASR